MPTLGSALQIAVQSLMVQQQALNVTTNNIANANTEGYAREIVNLTANLPVHEGSVNYGTGVSVSSLTSVRDELIGLQIYDEKQQNGNVESQYLALQEIERLFADPSSGIGGDLQAFFNSISALSTDPASISLRQTVLTAANNLARTFRDTSAEIDRVISSLDTSVDESATQINALTKQIAELNGAVSAERALGRDPGTLQDQLNQLTEELSGLVEIKVIHTEQGDNITLSSGTSLVVGNRSYELTTTSDSDGKIQVFSGRDNITSLIRGGTLGGSIEARDAILPRLEEQLDSIAYQFVTAVNTANRTGYDLSGAPGNDFFSSLASSENAASLVSLNTADPEMIAASADGSRGDGTNLKNVLSIRNDKGPSGASISDLFQSLVFEVANQVAVRKNEQSASDSALLQLKDRRSAVSGVSLDEETTNLIKYQRAYEAAAHIISVIDEMTSVVLNMGSR